MILSENIPRTADAFLRRCRIDVMKGRFAKPPDAYLEFLIEASRRADPRILEYLRVNDRKSGDPRYYGQADHIVPRAVWITLMPDDLIGGRHQTATRRFSPIFFGATRISMPAAISP